MSYKQLLLTLACGVMLAGVLFKFSPLKNWLEVDSKKVGVTIEEAVPKLSPTQTPSPTPTPLKLLVGGDLMFDRHIRQHAAQQGNDFIFAKMKPLLTSVDAVLVNLEGPITDNPSRSLGSQVGSTNNFIFTFPVSLAQTLKAHNISIVNLGNNHILNFGQAGVTDTVRHLQAAEVAFFGYVSPENTNVQPSLVTEIRDVKVGLVNYNQFAQQDKNQVVQLLKKLRPEVDLLLVYTHWDNEYQRLPAQVTVNLAHAFVEAGADMVIGSHPHVTQNREDYQGKIIYYSLGNFVFDQYFEPAVKRGMMLELTYDKETKNLSVIEHEIDLLATGQTVPATTKTNP